MPISSITTRPLIKAQVFRSGKTDFHCQLEDKSLVSAVARSTLLKECQPVVGDYVLLDYIDSAQEYEIKEILERKNELFRSLVRNKKQKIFATNIDLMAIVMSVAKPSYKPGLLDRYYLRSKQWNLATIVVFNKIDEKDHDLDLDFEKEKLQHLGIPFFETSAQFWQNQPFDIDQLRLFIQNKTVLFVGQSGVGKSRLISALSEDKVTLKSQELAKGFGKGAHTTTWSEIIDCHHFLLVDSPGIRSLSLGDLSEDEIYNYFEDLHDYFIKCRYPNCSHQEDAGGCYFNTLNSDIIFDKILLARLNSYLRLIEERSHSQNFLRK